MPINPRTERSLHQKLPIDKDEKILAIYRHHWFIYVASWALGISISLLVLIAAAILTMLGGEGTLFEGRQSLVLAIGLLFSLLIAVASFVPVYLHAQEELVLTNESLLQTLEPSLFASKTDQLGLQNISDVSVRRDFLGMLFGYGHLNIETPGEQNNFRFPILANANQAAREIVSAQEEFMAALQGGHLPSRLGSANIPADSTASASIDPQQYQQFLAYQQMLAQQQQDQAAGTSRTK